jgi:hypothetical protein
MLPPLRKYRYPGHHGPHLTDIQHSQKNDLPKFAALRGSLTRIASPAGVTYLKQGSIKSGVYLGSKYHAVDIEGVPWEKKTALKKITAGEKRAKKKPPAVETAGVLTNFESIFTEQISDNLSTTEPDLLPKEKELSTKEPKAYKIKKSVVRARLLAYTNTKKGQKCLYFFTVTFPAGMPDVMGYRALNTWFTSLRKQRLLLDYLWVAERQKNGTVHFHIAVPHYMKVQHVNGIMRKILLGYAMRKELPFPPEKFARGKYNGVDIAGHRDNAGHKIPTNFAHKKKSGSLANYLTKYVTKNNETFSHLAWHNSRGFSALFTSVALSKESFEKTLLHHRLNWSKKFEGELFVFVPWFGNAPPMFWDALSPVNNFFQTLNI